MNRLRHHWNVWDSSSSYFYSSQGDGLRKQIWSDARFFHPMHHLSYLHVTKSYHHVCRICRPNKSFSWRHSAWTTHWCRSRFSGVKPIFWRKHQYTLYRTVSRSRRTSDQTSDQGDADIPNQTATVGNKSLSGCLTASDKQCLFQDIEVGMVPTLGHSRLHPVPLSFAVYRIAG